MKAPNLSRKLVLEDPVQVSDDAGGLTTTWTPLGVHWAQITPGTGRERLDSSLPRSIIPLRILVRASPVSSNARPHAGQRFVEGARVFNIIAITERDPSGRYLTCHAEEEVTT